jgi:hypothetical protein
MEEAMKDMVKITVIAAGFKDTAKKQMPQKQTFLPKTWKAGRDIPEQGELPVTPPSVVHQVAQNVRESAQDVPKDDLDVPTFLRRQAQKA